MAKHVWWYYASQSCYIGSSPTAEVLNVHTFTPTCHFFIVQKKKKNALKKAKVITRLYFSLSEAIKNASCTLTVCDWLTRYQSTGFHGCLTGVSYAKPQAVTASCHTGIHSKKPFLQEMMWSYAAFQIPSFFTCWLYKVHTIHAVCMHTIGTHYVTSS